uniref:Expansin n=1 Tax=Heterodera glycines TaxID=51029 RepID=H6TDC2_HETGL|nr:expansin [Heterodera glycines]
MNAFFSFGIFLAIQFHAQFVLADVTASIKPSSTWNGGGQYILSFKNNDNSKTVCSVKFTLTPASGTSISAKWGFDAVSGASNQYTLSNNADIAPGATNSNGGLNIQGTNPNGPPATPTLQLIEAKYYSNGVCGGSSSSSGGGSSSSSSSCMGCLASTGTSGPIDSYIGKSISNSVFTFYGGGGRGACGLDSGVPKMSAAGSGKLFKSDGQWKDACRADKQYMLDDPICKDICIKIDYNGKSLTVPINNKCPECDVNHVDLTIDAFNYLEPRGGEVGKATGATLTYMKCPSNIKAC